MLVIAEALATDDLLYLGPGPGKHRDNSKDTVYAVQGVRDNTENTVVVDLIAMYSSSLTQLIIDRFAVVEISNAF